MPLRPFTLPSGAKPTVPGFGTGTKWYKPGNPAIDRNVVDAVASAIKLGYRHVDGAEIYGTDPEIGLAIKEAGVPRSELFVTNKIIANIADPRKALLDILSRMQLDYLDLCLIHTPFFSKEKSGISIAEAWKVLETLKAEGLAKNIGVSNFAKKDIDAVLAVATEPIAVNQIEFSPYLQNQTEGIVEYCQSKGIRVAAYTPLTPITTGKGGPLDPVLAKLAAKYGKTESQIVLKWVVARGVIPITTSAKPTRQAESLDLDGFELDPADVDEISTVGAQKHVRCYFTAEYNP
ncbi:NADP-dependent oxidoreductase domain-containing protein [Dipodascopsis tothii]|uniref:NADP-dependent oxidoreductase domain-containing protein n=1 Tax=Dipodascopsis tothii TaxID=44089 RepID=UPI0034CDE237